jgi:hypothetical protein
MSTFNTFYPEGKKLTISGEEFTIKPFVLRMRTQVLRTLADVYLELSKRMPKDNSEIASVIITVAGEKLIDIYELVLGKDKEWLQDRITLKDEIEIIQAIAEVNDIPFLFSQVKGLIKTLKNQKNS